MGAKKTKISTTAISQIRFVSGSFPSQCEQIVVVSIQSRIYQNETDSLQIVTFMTGGLLLICVFRFFKAIEPFGSLLVTTTTRSLSASFSSDQRPSPLLV